MDLPLQSNTRPVKALLSPEKASSPATRATLQDQCIKKRLSGSDTQRDSDRLLGHVLQKQESPGSQDLHIVILKKASCGDQEDVVRLILKAGTPLHWHMGDRRLIIHDAAARSNHNILRLLLASGGKQ